MNIEAWHQHHRAIAERADPYCLAYIDQQGREARQAEGIDERGRRHTHAQGHDIELRQAAELERLWGRVAMAIANCERELNAMADTQHDLICEQRACLRDAAAALQPYAFMAMNLRTTHGNHFRILFDQNERARS